MSVTVGTLTIDLKANTASFSGSMDKMSHLSAKTANDIKRSLEKIAAAGLAMGAAIAPGTAALITHSLDSVDALYKLAQSAGTTTETLSVLNYAGLSNVSSEELGKGLEKLNKSAFSAQNSELQLWLRRKYQRSWRPARKHWNYQFLYKRCGLYQMAGRVSHLPGLRRTPPEEDGRRAGCGKSARPVR